ncbi:MAG: hypothetical protein M3Y33_21300 [Actinomycetota bacterium]|nr:hypothetical protein [Actinomycetota bacterium]
MHAINAPANISLSADAGHQHQGAGQVRFRGHARWSFSTLDNRNDPTFNQLLGINNRGVIAGYFGSGAQGHPNQGYLLFLSQHRSQHRSQYVNENVPRAVQTQVVGLNDRGVTVGFWSGQNTARQMNANLGFYTWGGRFHSVAFPTRNNSHPPVNQLLGVNGSDVAVGFYNDSQGNPHGYTYSITRHRIHSVIVPGGVSDMATGINNEGVISGFVTGPAGVTRAFVKTPGGRITRLTFPGATSTQAFGINDSGEVVGTYMIGSGTSAKSYGFTWARFSGFRSVTDPLGPGATTLNGINDAGDLVGFYNDAAGHTHGLLWAAGHFTAPPAPPVAPVMAPGLMPTPTMSVAPAITAAPAIPVAPPVPNPVVSPTHF